MRKIMRDYPHVVFVAAFVLFICVPAWLSILSEWQSCSDRGGSMVQGLSWNGYVCVEGK